ncbi:His Kinase A (phospho-acceptor) domain-containing protein [Flavobacterium flevense]|uniref:histidine kinase n=1 Tax=Flavobacterium flevense TaxID=983 RepID=A0A4Y4AZC4_9FLAO|nr:ATP-binding protein [Flavobacterium flevense]GEC71944.1 hybrid sensor histidine kinase/response regulator [Flavobacterium flevense]SHL46382.1 His Kinase A (phospho-acceptor) domain-containing protein [Flavobacterium flevense]
MGHKNSNIPVKVFVSYMILASLVASVGWILYTENMDYSKIENKIAFEKNKVLKVSQLFSNVYKTESLARKTIQSNSETDYKEYIQETNSLQKRIGILKKSLSSEYQIKLLDSVMVLLTEKTQNIKHLKAIKSKTSDEASVNEAIEELTQLELSLSKLKLQDFTRDPEKLNSHQRNVLQNYIDYLNQNIPDDPSNTLTKKETDSILAASKRLLSKVKLETEKKKESLSIQESKLLTNELLISDQLRKVLRVIEQEILTASVKNNNEKEKSLKKINQIVTYAAILGLLLTIVFSILIASDFSKTQSYKKQLEIANFKTQNLLKSREQLISTVSHDLKTPLSTIMGYAELLGNSTLTSKQSYFTNNIKNSSDYISRLVQDLLDFSQIEAGKINLEKKSFSLAQTIQEVATNLQSVYSQKNIELLISIDEKLQKPIIGDAFRLKQVLINIIGNAYKFTEEGFIKITVLFDSKSQKAYITIEDSGIGIEKESQNLVFEEFAQANETIEKKYGGTGLGLAISKKIITLLGGDLYLKSSSKKGSCFEIVLAVTFDEQPEIKEKIPASFAPSQLNKTIVVVDDDSDLLQLTTEVLKEFYTVISFSNAEHALQSLTSEPFDMLITDIQMPVTDGFELLKKLQKKKNKSYREQPVIAVTGRTDLAEEIYKKAGFTAILKKPFTPAILLQTIDAIFNKAALPVQENEIKKPKNENELFSLDSLKLFLKEDNEAIKTVLQSFITSTNSNLFMLENSIKTIDYERIKQVSHKMAPMFKQIEATEIAGILNNLESKDYSDAELQAIYLDIKSKIKTLLQDLEKVI